MDKIYVMLEELHPEHNFKESRNYIDDGLLDSFDIITLVDMIEEEYGVIIDGLDILPENFSSVDAIIGLIEKSEKLK